MSVRVGVSVRECSNVCRVQHRHGETRPRARGSCVLLLLSTAHHQTPAGGLGPRRPPSSTRRCAELASPPCSSGRPRSRRAWSHLLAPARRFQPRMLMLRWMGFVVVVTKHFVEEQRQETRGWKNRRWRGDPPRCLVQPACTDHFPTSRSDRPTRSTRPFVSVWLQKALSRRQRGRIWWMRHGCFPQKRRVATAPTARATCPASCRLARSRQVGSSSRHVTASCVGAADGRTRRPTRARRPSIAPAPPHAGPRWAVQYNQEYR